MANTCECDSCVSDRDHTTSAAPPRTYRAMPAEYNEAAYAAQHAAEHAQDSLLRRFEALAALVAADVTEHEGVKSLLDGVKEEVEKQSLATDYMIHYIPREFRRPEQAAPLGRKVFGTPELLEKILLFAFTRTVFDSMRVSKDFFNTIEGSLKLQRKVGLMADPEAHVSGKGKAFLDSDEETGMHFDMSSEPHVETKWGPVLNLEFNVTPVRGQQIRIPGARVRSVLLTQPPIKHLEVSVSCCGDRYGSSYSRPSDTPSIANVQNETGITVGELRDKVLQLTEAHRLCPHAPLQDHDGVDGRVNSTVRFNGDLMLRDDDYSILNGRAARAERRQKDDKMEAFEMKIGPYMRAKAAAHHNYLPIPTLAEFEAEKTRRMGLEKKQSD